MIIYSFSKRKLNKALFIGCGLPSHLYGGKFCANYTSKNLKYIECRKLIDSVK